MTIGAGTGGVTFYFKDSVAETGIEIRATDGTLGYVYGIVDFAAAPVTPPATPVGYNSLWLIITLVSLTLVGGFLLRRRMARQ